MTDVVRILVAEDDLNIRVGLVATLESEGYVVDEAADGLEAQQMTERNIYDLVMLDVMMPNLSGYDLCRALRTQNPCLPIMMLTARSEEIDKVMGLKLGADDYITKPFGIAELLARVAALLRRAKASAQPKEDESATFYFGSLRIDPKQQRAFRGEITIDLSARELVLLRYFSQHPDEVLDRNKLLNVGWGRDYFGTSRTLDQHIAQLRKKIEPDPSTPQWIVTVFGVGYRYCPPAQS